MAKLQTPIHFLTATAEYVADEIIGEGGVGRVYAATSDESRPVAVKLLNHERATSKQRRRFRNELAFLQRTNHPNVVSAIDAGVYAGSGWTAPFYVMHRFDGPLPILLKEVRDAAGLLGVFTQILDGVEAAHLKEVWHRDLKPQNILVRVATRVAAIADFGAARFHEAERVANVETSTGDRLGNFRYAAPEQRRFEAVDARADIYALGLILNEMYTGNVPLGASPRKIQSAHPSHGFLDPIAERMLADDPAARPASIEEVKLLIKRSVNDAASLQRLSEMSGDAVQESVIDDPLALSVVRVVGAEWSGDVLRLQLSLPVNARWHQALRRAVRTSVWNAGPERFEFRGTSAQVPCTASDAQRVIDYFKEWLPGAQLSYKDMLESETRRRDDARRERLARERQEEERRLSVNRSLRL